MTDALFLAVLTDPAVGDEVELTGDEGRHAAAVRRLRVGERVLVSDGAGTGVRGEVTRVDKASMALRVDEVLHEPEGPVHYVAVQALAKGDRAELAVEVLTELGVDEVVPWPASRSIVKWVPERAERHLMRWRATAREATKQSRQLRVPIVSMPLTTREIALRIEQSALTLILHEDAVTPLADVELPTSGELIFIVGPEGGIAPEELAEFEAAGGRPVRVAAGVLRTSTAGLVALAQVQALAARRA